MHLTHLVLSSATVSNEIFCGLFLIKNLVIFVPTTLAKQILFCNHLNKKVVGGKHNVLIHCVNVCAPNLSGFVLYKPFKWDILCSFLIKNHLVVFVPSTTTVKWISFCNHSNRKVAGDKHNVLLLYVDVSASNISGVVFCIPFIWDIWLFIRDQRKRVTQIKYLRVWW